MNEKISSLLNSKTEFTGCGRTDTGVHAREFYAHFDSQSENLHTGDWVYKFNCVLPRDIAIQRIIAVPNNAHARYDALSRTYEYFIVRQRDPFMNERAAFIHSPLDIDLMNRACAILYDYSDFTSFSKLRTQVKTNNCKVTSAAWRTEKDLLVFSITADRFLRNMVRAIVGTLVGVGKGEISPEKVREIIESKNRGNAGESFPACGLYLVRVSYPAEIFKSE